MPGQEPEDPYDRPEVAVGSNPPEPSLDLYPARRDLGAERFLAWGIQEIAQTIRVARQLG